MITLLRVCSYVSDDLRKREMIDLGWLEGDIYVILFYGFESDNRVNFRVIFVKDLIDVTKKIKFNRWKCRMT